jgi:hypothetical protein
MRYEKGLVYYRRHDIQHNDTMNSDTQLKDTWHYNKISNLSITLSRMLFMLCCSLASYSECRYAKLCNADCHYGDCHYAECRYAECHYSECHYSECHYT